MLNGGSPVTPFLYDMWGKELTATGSITFLRHRWIGELGYGSGR